MNTKLPAYGILPSLKSRWGELLGKRQACGILTTIVALTGRTATPTHARTVGTAECHEILALGVEEFCGKSGAEYVTAISPSGFLSLDDPKLRASCLIVDGSKGTLELLSNLSAVIMGNPVRMLDGTTSGVRRNRKMEGRFSTVIIHGDNISDPPVLRRQLTIEMNQTREVSEPEVRNLEQVAAGIGSPLVFGGCKAESQHLDALAWETEVDFRHFLPKDRSTLPREHLSRLATLFSLARVYRILSDELTQPGPVVGTVTDLTAILELLDLARVEDFSCRLSKSASQTLAMLNTNGFLSGFNVYDLVKLVPNLSADTFRMRIKELDAVGLVEYVDRVNRRHTWKLTERGRQFQNVPLAVPLRNLLPVLNQLTSPKSE